MAELSHRALRELLEDFGGCDEYYSEMISAGALIEGGRFESYYTDGGPCPEKTVLQLLGADIAQLAAAASLLDRLPCRGIDLNMGCSAPAITRTGGGVKWMGSIDKAGALIDAIRVKTSKRLSVKLRIGWEDDFDYLVQFCKRLEAGGVELIALHPRTAREKFKRKAKWAYIPALQAELGIPLAGNGDILSPEELADKAKQTPGGVMVGRGAIRSPWIFAAARELERSGKTGSAESAAWEAPERPPKRDIEGIALRFLELLSKHQPPEFHASRARRFFAYFLDNLIWGNYLKNLLARETTLAGMEAILRAHFRTYPDDA